MPRASSGVDAGGDFIFGLVIVAGCLIAGLVFLLAVYGARTALYAGPVFAIALAVLVLVNVFAKFAIPGWLTLRGPVAAALYVLTFFGVIAAFQAWTNDVSPGLRHGHPHHRLDPAHRRRHRHPGREVVAGRRRPTCPPAVLRHGRAMSLRQALEAVVGTRVAVTVDRMQSPQALWWADVEAVSVDSITLTRGGLRSVSYARGTALGPRRSRPPQPRRRRGRHRGQLLRRSPAIASGPPHPPADSAPIRLGLELPDRSRPESELDDDTRRPRRTAPRARPRSRWAAPPDGARLRWRGRRGASPAAGHVLDEVVGDRLGERELRGPLARPGTARSAAANSGPPSGTG